MMIIDNKFAITQTVYLKTDKDQLPRLVTGLKVNSNGLLYSLTAGTQDSDHYDFEISETADVMLSTTN